MDEILDPDLLDDDPFEIDAQAAHLFKHPHLGIDDVLDVWENDPLFYPAKPPAHWLLVAEVGGRVLVVPIAPSRQGDLSPDPPICAGGAPVWTRQAASRAGSGPFSGPAPARCAPGSGVTGRASARPAPPRPVLTAQPNAPRTRIPVDPG